MRLVFCLALLSVTAAPAQPATVAGTLVGASGQPVEVAHAHLVQSDSLAATVPVGAEGGFELPVGTTGGAVLVRFTGLHHRALDLPMHLDAGATVELDARLAALPLAKAFTDVRLQRDGPGTGRTLKPRPDGTFAETFPARTDTFAYELSGVTADRRLVPGTAWDRLALVDGGAYVSVLDTRGDSVTIVFDPMLLPRADVGPTVTFADAASRAARTATVLRRLDNRSERVYRARLAAMRSTEEASDEERAAALVEALEPLGLEAEQIRLSALLAEESDPAVRRALLLSYVSVQTDERSKEPGIGVRALEEIGAEAALWSLHPALVQRALDLAALADAEAADAWARRFIAEHPDPAVRAYALFRGLVAADATGDEGAAQGYYVLLQTDEYAETEPGLIASVAFAPYDPDGTVAVGALVPDFEVETLGGDTVSRTSLLGSTYLVDFWAIWCVPCIDEMPTLHAAYDRFHDDGFEILSLSFDDSPDQVRYFHTNEFPMPWLNAHVASGFTGDIAERFEVRGLPKPILVGPDGRILALSSGELRGAFLERTLEQHFADEGSE